MVFADAQVEKPVKKRKIFRKKQQNQFDGNKMLLQKHKKKIMHHSLEDSLARVKHMIIGLWNLIWNQARDILNNSK